MSNSQQAAHDARALFLTRCGGVLSTHSVDVEGYPFGSITPYCVDNQGRPVILISTIAQHTANIKVNPKVSLIAFDPLADDSQATARVTYVGDAKLIKDEAIAQRYYRFFPSAQGFGKTHDFNFYVIECVRLRFIGGFGEIYWLEQSDFIKQNPFSFEEEVGMVEHMNADHQAAINHYCDLYSLAYDDKYLPQLVGIDAEGFHLRVGDRLERIKFDEQISTTTKARQALVALAKKSL